jgi:hypothetical protein
MRELREYLAADPLDGADLAYTARRADRDGTKRRNLRRLGELELARDETFGVCRGAESNCLRRPFQGWRLRFSSA